MTFSSRDIRRRNAWGRREGTGERRVSNERRCHGVRTTRSFGHAAGCVQVHKYHDGTVGAAGEVTNVGFANGSVPWLRLHSLV